MNEILQGQTALNAFLALGTIFALIVATLAIRTTRKNGREHGYDIDPNATYPCPYLGGNVADMPLEGK